MSRSANEGRPREASHDAAALSVLWNSASIKACSPFAASASARPDRFFFGRAQFAAGHVLCTTLQLDTCCGYLNASPHQEFIALPTISDTRKNRFARASLKKSRTGHRWDG